MCDIQYLALLFCRTAPRAAEDLECVIFSTWLCSSVEQHLEQQKQEKNQKRARELSDLVVYFQSTTFDTYGKKNISQFVLFQSTRGGDVAQSAGRRIGCICCCYFCPISFFIWFFVCLFCLYPEGRPVMSDVSPHVWNLRAVIGFHITIFSLVLLPSPVTLSVLSFFLPAGPFSDFFSRKLFNIFS